MTNWELERFLQSILSILFYIPDVELYGGWGRSDLASRVFLSFMMQNEIREETYVRFKIVLAAYGTRLGISFGAGGEVKSQRLCKCWIRANIRRSNFGTYFGESLEQSWATFPDVISFFLVSTGSPWIGQFGEGMVGEDVAIVERSRVSWSLPWTSFRVSTEEMPSLRSFHLSLIGPVGGIAFREIWRLADVVPCLDPANNPSCIS